ncbi:MAG: vanadium-dependent haloperoxidase [Bacteroidota bacterium]
MLRPTMLRRVLFMLPLLCAFGVLSACEEPAPKPVDPVALETASDPELLHAAVKHLTDVMIRDIFSPPQAARAYAYTTIAAYEAMVPDTPDLRSLAGQVAELEAVPASPADAEIHHPLAATQAAYTVAEALVFSPAEIAVRQEAMEAEARAALPEALVEASLAYGDAVAQHILAWVNTDGYRETRSAPTYTVTDEPGRWVPTPPAYMDGVEPSWSQIRPFALETADQFAPPPPPPYSLDHASEFFRQAQEVYQIGATITEEQRAIASFWDCNPYVMHTRGHAMFATKKLTPGGHWVGIAAIASRMRGDDFAATAEAYTRTAIALSDAFISAWDEKYRSNLIRPETVINAHIDDAWVPVLQTPPFPEYTSGHSVISAAASVVLTDYFGDDFAFSDTTEVEYGLPVRDFPSFSVAAEEAAISRLYGGIHYRFAADEGLKQGRNVGRHVVERLQTRVPTLATQ